MSVVLDDPFEYERNPFYVKNLTGDFSPFYIAIGICTVLGVGILLLNIFFCCCSKHKHYWQDSNTGNRWILPIWTKTPHLQPPLDYTELDKSWIPVPAPVAVVEREYSYEERMPQVYLELQKRESDI